VTIEADKLTGEFFAADAESPPLDDAFVLDMDNHKVTDIGS
jgi:hypothetical protein